jgi:transposase
MPFSVRTISWWTEHSSFVVKEFIQNGGLLIMTQRALCVCFGLSQRDPVPDKKTIHSWVSNFRQTGSALKRKSTGQPQNATGPENVAAVRASIERSPQRCARKQADAVWLSDRSVWRILHRDLKLHPYKIVIAQELIERDCESHTTSCRELLQNVPCTTVLLFMDEAHFHLSGAVNKQNFRYWSNSNPWELHQRPLHSPKVTVWYAIFEFGVWGSYFFLKRMMLL